MVVDGNIIQVTNIGYQATKDQMQQFFNIIGKVDELRLYPEDEDPTLAGQSKCCFVKFRDIEDAAVALHLNNTVFIDKALIIAPFKGGDKIPLEREGLEIAAVAPQISTGSKFPRWPPNVTNNIVGTGQAAVLHTHDPKLEALNLPTYPPLPANTDPVKIDEIRRSVFVGNLDPFVTAEQLIQHFSQAGEVMYVRSANEQSSAQSRYAFVEFSHQSSVPMALALDQTHFMNNIIKVTHANSTLTKQQQATAKQPKGMDEATKREADRLISAAVDAPINLGSSMFQRKLFGLSGDGRKVSPGPPRRRSRSPRRYRSRSRSPRYRSSRRRRSRTPPPHYRRHRSPAYSPPPSPFRHSSSRRHHRSPPRRHRRSRSRERRRRSRSREHRSRRSRRSRSRRSASPAGDYEKPKSKKKTRKRRSPSEDSASSGKEDSPSRKPAAGDSDSVYSDGDQSSAGSNSSGDDLMDTAVTS